MGAVPTELDEKVGLSLDEIIKATKAQERAELVIPARRLGPRTGYSNFKARPVAETSQRAISLMRDVYSSDRRHRRRRIPKNSKITVSVVNDRQHQRPKRRLRQPAANLTYPIDRRSHGLTGLADRLEAVSRSPENYIDAGCFEDDDDDDDDEQRSYGTASDLTDRSIRRDSRSPLQSSFARAQAERLRNSGRK
ncbi:hypothetical protein HDU87_004842 [Geranomyces variabilis]|uniref:Uncharacterized protein n=1 Tax=Geranomyces variabilis TaxID=109894 RepID=A0AAD5THI7_9FUNG|nr:hypothetical protein HDU87_004842 [Geranomyces variabilis]